MDGTKELCDRLGYNMVTLSINSGIGAAVQTGYLYGHRFGYDYAIQIDGDGQHDAKFLEKMADVMEAEEINMLIGSRFLEGEDFSLPVSDALVSVFYLADPFIDRGRRSRIRPAACVWWIRKSCICLPTIILRTIREPETAVTVLKKRVLCEGRSQWK